MRIKKAHRSVAVKNLISEILSPKVENLRKWGYFDHTLGLHL
jgi:hypothetical protein